jgi:competence protein ComEA
VEAEPTEVVVHAAGAVTTPGLYRLPPDARVADVVAAAGGLAADADGDRLNLAAPLADGMRVYVPRVGEAVVPPVVAGEAPSQTTDGETEGDPTTGGPEALVDVNTATAAELDELPGVGPATAEAIIDHREEQGPFRSVDDLLDVRGIGDAKLADLRDRVRV